MHKVEGNALIYSLFIVLVISSIVTLVLMISKYSAQNVIAFQQGIQKQYNLNSGIELLLSKDPFQKLNTTKKVALFSNSKNEIITKRMQWGLYEIIGVTNNATAKYGIIGYQNKNQPTLYLANTNQSLKVTGNTRVEGLTYLPEKGIERGNLTGHPYKGDKLIYGTKLKSQKSLPPLNKTLLKYLEAKESPLDSIVLWNNLTDSITQHFDQKTLHFISSSSIDIDNQKINGNVVIESNKSISVATNSNLENIVLIAPFISIADEFNGTLQLQARDSITIGESVYLDYPSSIVLYDTKPVKDITGYIKVGTSSVIIGELLAFQKEYNYRDKISIQCAPKSSITGNVYVNGVAHLQDMVLNGSLYCQQINVKTGGSNHNNTLLDVMLSNAKRSEYYLGGNLLDEQKSRKKGIINWLE